MSRRLQDSHESARALARARQDGLTKPRGSLGELEWLAVELAGIQRRECPASRPARALVFACDHPVARHGVSAFPPSVTAAMLANFASGGAAATVLARALGVPLRVVDVGVAAVPAPARADGRHPVVCRDPAADLPAGDIRCEDAMAPPVLEACLAAGRRAVEALGSRVRVLILGEMGIANTTPASALVARILDRTPEEVVGRGTGLGERGLDRKRAVVRDALARMGPRDAGGLEACARALRRLGGREIAALVGAMHAAAARGLAVLVDGFVVSAAALAACGMEPGVRTHLLFAHRSAEAGHGLVLDALGARPLLDLGMRLGEASGALVALPLLDLACRLHARMATFEGAGVPERGDAAEDTIP